MQACVANARQGRRTRIENAREGGNGWLMRPAATRAPEPCVPLVHVDMRVPRPCRATDNGAEFIAKKVRSWIGAVGAKTAFITPGSPLSGHHHVMPCRAVHGKTAIATTSTPTSAPLKGCTQTVAGQRMSCSTARSSTPYVRLRS
jgi:hypothetical protein